MPQLQINCKFHLATYKDERIYGKYIILFLVIIGNWEINHLRDDVHRVFISQKCAARKKYENDQQ